MRVIYSIFSIQNNIQDLIVSAQGYSKEYRYNMIHGGKESRCLD